MQKQTFAGKQNNFTLIFFKFRIQQGDRCLEFFQDFYVPSISINRIKKHQKIFLVRLFGLHFIKNILCKWRRMHGNENQQLLLYEKRLFSCQSSLKRYQKKIGFISFKKGTTSTTPIEFMYRVAGFHEENCFLTGKKVSCEIFFRKAVDYPQLLFGEAL